MPLKKSVGNMYVWTTHTWNALIGKCPHECDYCYVGAMKKRFPNMKAMYEGKPRFNPADENIDLGIDKKIFVAHTADLFAAEVPDEVINKILDICNKHYHNHYVLQTKNPARYLQFLDKIPKENFELGTTVETDDATLLHEHSKAPAPAERLSVMRDIKAKGYKTFVTIEPIMKMSPGELADMLADADPDFVNIGADSKKASLPEPTWDEVQTLILNVRKFNIEIRVKDNLERLNED